MINASLRPHRASDETRAMTPCAMMPSVDRLFQERIRAYAMGQATSNRTDLENRVDDMLDTLYTLHRLEQLASRVAEGGYINVDADRIFIAQNAETYRRLLEKYAAQNPSGAAVVNTLLPRYPVPIG